MLLEWVVIPLLTIVLCLFLLSCLILSFLMTQKLSCDVGWIRYSNAGKKIAFLSSEETKLDNIYLHSLSDWKGHCCEMVWISVPFYICNLIFIKCWCSVTALYSQAVVWSIAVGTGGWRIGSTDFTQQLLTELLCFDWVAKLEDYVKNSYCLNVKLLSFCHRESLWLDEGPLVGSRR